MVLLATRFYSWRSVCAVVKPAIKVDTPVTTHLSPKFVPLTEAEKASNLKKGRRVPLG